jgi:hypothetical protein
MHINRFRAVLIGIFWVYGHGLWAQGSSGQNFLRSPYSNFGLGEWMPVQFYQAGTAGQTYGGQFSHSLSNPATLGNMRYTVLDFGGSFRNGNTSQGDQVYDFQGGNFEYMSLALPIWKTVKQKMLFFDSAKNEKVWKYTPYGATTAIALRPLSTMGYAYYIDEQSVLPTRTAFQGSGGLNMLQWNTGFRFGDWVNVGYGVGTLFGNTRDNAIFTVRDSFSLGAVEDSRTIKYRGFQQQIGVLFEGKWDSTYHRFGATYEWFAGTQAEVTRMVRSMEVVSGLSRVLDTVLNDVGVSQRLELPAALSLGYSFRYRRSWMLALDWRRQMWGQFTGVSGTAQLRDRNEYSATLFINPMDLKASNEKRMKIPVRLSYSLGESQILLQQGTDLYGLQEHRYGIGFGIPIIRRYFDNTVLTNIIQFNIQYMTRAAALNSFPREQFITVGLGLQLGDIWFAKRKYD